jgi:hypothetical protein
VDDIDREARLDEESGGGADLHLALLGDVWVSPADVLLLGQAPVRQPIPHQDQVARLRGLGAAEPAPRRRDLGGLRGEREAADGGGRRGKGEEERGRNGARGRPPARRPDDAICEVRADHCDFGPIVN